MEQTESDEGGLFQKPIDNDALKKLCSLLKSKADRVLNGQASFSLTTDVLCRITHDCRRHSLKQNEDENSSSDGTGLRWQSKFLGLHNKKRESIEEEWKGNIQFVKDFILSTPSVKIIHKHGTISFPINLCRFGNLRILILRKVPIHLVEGLQTARGRLKSLVANHCLSKPKDILESCGGDRSAPLSWQQLKYLALIFNDIRHLDDSFRLLPDIETIDLSHNLIETCGNYLEYLSDVLSVNLAYNALLSVPIFSVNTRNSLTTLNLRGNNLDSIQGIEVAVALNNLDVGENYMVKHTALWPLKSLTCLCQLQLDGNPLYYHKHHRLSTISSLMYRVVTTEFLLDGRKLTRSEILSYIPPKAEVQRAFLATHHLQSPRSVSINANDPYIVSSSSGIGTADNSPAVIHSSTPRRKGKKKKIKARDTEIRDTLYDCSSGHEFTPAGSPSLKYLEEQMEAKRLEALKTKREVELLKEHYGPDYLQAIEDRKLFSQTETASYSASDGVRIMSKSKKHKRNLSFTKKEISENSEEVHSHVLDNSQTTAEMLTKIDASTNAVKEAKDEDSKLCERKNEIENTLTETEESITAKDARMEEAAIVRNPISNPIMAAIERIASGQSSDESGAEKNASSGAVISDIVIKETDESVHENNKGNRDLMQYKDVGDKGKLFEQSPGKLSPLSSTKTTISEVQINDDRCMYGANESVKMISKLSQSLSMEDASTNEKDLSSLSPRSNIDTPKSYLSSSLNQSTSEMDSSTDNSLQLSESENESEAMFVTLPEEKDKMIIVTFTDLFLVEKDVRGKVTEKLDLRSLHTLETKRLRKRSSSDDIASVEGWKNHGTAEKLEEDSKTKEMALRLKFDYIRRDRRRRCYLVDINDGKKMVAHLQPFIDSKVEKEKAKDSVVMQCLKCNKTFSKKDLTQKSQQLPRSGSSKDFHTLKQLTDNPKWMCPACGNSIIIELEVESCKSTGGSNQPTPVGSYNSTGSFMESPQKQQKPAPLLRNRSFDSQSTEAKIAANLVKRKLSATSAESEKPHQRTSSGSSSVKSLILSGSSPQSYQQRKISVTETRERSNAFKAVFPRTSSTSQMAQNTFLASKEQTPMESEELLYVDDHFSPEKMRPISSSQQLAWMTSSLRGDVSTKGKDAVPSHKLYKQCNVKDSEEQKQQMEDSGFESGIYLSGSSNLTSHDVDNSDNRQIETGSRKIGEKKGENAKGEGDFRDSSQRRDIPEGYKYLASMEHRVNSLVKEGEYLERQEGVGKSNARRRRSSISVSDLKKLISTNASPRKDYIESDLEGDAAFSTFHNSASGSSIAILPTNGNEEPSLPIAQSDSLGFTPVRFVIGSVEKNVDPPITEGSSSDLNRVSSPLNSNICNSMVSSVYETSVVSSEKKGISSEKSKPVVLGSSNSSISSGTDEDLVSIYDQPSNLHSASVKCKKKKRKNEKAPFETSPKDAPPSKEEEKIPQDSNGRQSPASSFPEQHQSSPTSIEDAGAYLLSRSLGTNGDSDNESVEIEFDNSILEAETTYRFDHLNHRLTLYLMMSLFSNDEEFMCKLQTEIVQYIVDESYSGILIMSTQRFYVLKITSDDHSKEPEEWLSCVEVQPIPEIRYIDIGLGGQSLRIEFVTDCSSFTLVTKDKEKTMQFVDVLHHNLAKYAITRGISCNVIVNEDVDQITLENLDADVVSKGKSQHKLLHYSIGFIERGNQKLFPISFVVSTSSICLVRTNHQWPQPRLQGPITVETVGKQFTVLERQMINLVASVEICEKSLRKLKLELFNESEGVSNKWNITMTNRQNALNFIHAISEPWAKEYGVEMEVTYSQLDF